jgi:hypothetical protein
MTSSHDDSDICLGDKNLSFIYKLLFCYSCLLSPHQFYCFIVLHGFLCNLNTEGIISEIVGRVRFYNPGVFYLAVLC